MDQVLFAKTLEDMENGQDLLEYHNQAVLAEKTRGIEEFRRANKDVTKFKRFKNLVHDLGWDGESDVDEWATKVKSALEAKASPAEQGEMGELKKTLAKLQKDFQTTQTDLAAEREQRAELQKINRVKTIEAQLGPKLSEEFYASPLMLKALIADNMVDVDESGEVVFKKGDSTLNLNDGLKYLSETYSDAKKNKQVAGSGSRPSSQSARPKYSLDQIRSMSPTQIAQDIDNINASMRIHNGVT